MENPITQLEAQKTNFIVGVAASIAATIFVTLLNFFSTDYQNLLFKAQLDRIEKNYEEIFNNKQEIKKINDGISTSQSDLEKQVRLYIETQHGTLSDREATIEELSIRHQELRIRLKNIENLLKELYEIQ